MRFNIDQIRELNDDIKRQFKTNKKVNEKTQERIKYKNDKMVQTLELEEQLRRMKEEI